MKFPERSLALVPLVAISGPDAAWHTCPGVVCGGPCPLMFSEVPVSAASPLALAKLGLVLDDDLSFPDCTMGSHCE